MKKVICLWASPRNISTALMYSFAQRLDVKVMDEPFYAYYLTHVNSSVYHPGKNEILNSQSSDFKKILSYINSDCTQEFLFIKNMTHHLKGSSLSFASNWINIILTRNPKKSLTSFSKVVKNPTQDDVGYKLQYEAALRFNEMGANFYILNSDDLLNNPKKELKKLCHFSSLSFQDNMLKWSKGGINEDGVWARYWYENAHNSTGFKKVKMEREIKIDRSLSVLEKECNYYYQKLINMEVVK
jgi:hypothetical protein